MSDIFDVLYRGGVVTQNGVRYTTVTTPPANDNSTKVATTAWVRDITDGLEASVSGGMFPTIRHAIRSNNNVVVPTGGTWWVYYCYDGFRNNSMSGGAFLFNGSVDESTVMCIKIA